MNFNDIPDRRGTHSSKWDGMERLFGVSPAEGLAMWTADSDYRTADCVLAALRRSVDFGIFGYYTDQSELTQSVAWWMQTRLGWTVDPDWVLTAQGLGNAIALCLDTYSDPGDSAVIFSPVYHEFALKIRKTGRNVTEVPLVRQDDTYVIDFDDAQARLTGREKLLIWCSPQNPSGRIWTKDELKAVYDFAERNNLILVSDEVHGDLVMPGNQFVPLGLAVPESRNRLVALTAASKTFNLAGLKVGNLIIPDDDLRRKMVQRLNSLDYGASRLGLDATIAAYSPEGAEWVDAQNLHLETNCRIFNQGIALIPGVRSLPLQSTYLAWVDFADTGMTQDEFKARIREHARIAASPGDAFGAGGETFMRFNLATSNGLVKEAVARLQSAFADLQ